VFQASRGGFPQLHQKRLDGTGNEEPILTFDTVGASFHMDWSPDGRYLAYLLRGAGNANGLWALPLFGDRKPFPLVQTSAESVGAVISPDGRWFAYQSSEGGQNQVFVRAFPPAGAPFQVSKDGGTQPIWRRDGKELFFLSPDSKLMAAAIETRAQFQAGVVTPLFTLALPPNLTPGGRQYAVTKDGRFLVNVSQQVAAIPVIVVVNWLAALQK
jgi:eukaryotic-like serine/threonine-protein kinase